MCEQCTRREFLGTGLAASVMLSGATWPYTLEQDAADDPLDGIPEVLNILDTPIDMGMGLPLVFGEPACSGESVFSLKRYDPDHLEPYYENDEFVWWRLKPEVMNPRVFYDTVVIEPVVRRNVMSYWACDPENQRFTEDQVNRMTFVLGNQRDYQGSVDVPVTRKRIPRLARKWYKLPELWDPLKLRRQVRRQIRRDFFMRPESALDEWVNTLEPYTVEPIF